MSHDHLLSGASVTQVTFSEGRRIFTLQTPQGPAMVIDPLNGRYTVKANGQEWQTTNAPSCCFGGA